MGEEKKYILWRIRLMYAFIALFAMAIFAKVLYIQFVEGDHWRELARSATIRYASIEAARGDIRADDGRLLATSIPVYEIRMDMSRQVVSDDIFNTRIDSLSRALSRLFRDRSAQQFKTELMAGRRSQERYHLVKRNVSYNELIQLRQFPIFRNGRYQGGLIVNERTRREMPYKALAARTIGYERAGVYVGLEGAYREYLEGIQGKRLMQRISGGTWMPINDENEIQPKNGMDLVTTINIRTQDVVDNALRRQLEKYEADYGTMVVMEVATGKIKAIANLTKNSQGGYDETFNYAVGESTEPGSTFKLATMIAILETGVAKPDEILHTGNGQIIYYDRVMRDAREGGFGTITLTEAFELSSNVGISKIVHDAFKNNPKRFTDKLRELGIDKPLGLEIQGEGLPQIVDVSNPEWSAVSLPWMAIGYGVSFTPLQILSLYNAIANNGRMVKPMLTEEIRYTGSIVKSFSPTITNRSIASSHTIKLVQEMLVGVVEKGTAKNIHTNLYAIAGKTGTAQIAQQKHGYTSTGGVSYQASFAGYFPADNPVYSMIVVINNPKGWLYSGSQIAAPVFREVADKIFATQMVIPGSPEHTNALANLPRIRSAHTDDLRHIYASLNCKIIDQASGSWGTTRIQNDTVSIVEKPMSQNLVPDVVGMGLRDAMYILENAGIRVRYAGRGSVRQQSILPNSPVGQQKIIFLELSQ